MHLNGTAATFSGQTRVTSLSILVDRRDAPAPSNTSYGGGFDGGPVSLPEEGVSSNELQLRALIDNSLLEVSHVLASCGMSPSSLPSVKAGNVNQLRCLSSCLVVSKDACKQIACRLSTFGRT